MAEVEATITLTFTVERTVPSPGTVAAIAKDTARQLSNSVNSRAVSTDIHIDPVAHDEPEPEDAEPEDAEPEEAAPKRSLFGRS